LSGTARDADGRPLAGATIVVRVDFGWPEPLRRRRADGQQTSAPPPMVTWTDADGRFAVAGLRPGDYFAMAQDQHGDCERHTKVLADGATEVSFVFGGSVALQGTVQRRSGEPVRGVMVALLDEQGNELERRCTYTRGEVPLRGPARALRVQAHRGEQL